MKMVFHYLQIHLQQILIIVLLELKDIQNKVILKMYTQKMICLTFIICMYEQKNSQNYGVMQRM